MKTAEPEREQPASIQAAPPGPASDILNVGELVCGDYEILRLVSASSEGETYETRHQITGQIAIVKALPVPSSLDPQGDERVKAEARALAKLVHPNLLALYNFRREGPRYLAVLQVPEGQPLEAQVLAAGPMALPRFFRIFEQVLDGMAFAHDSGLPHSRLTAQDIFVDGSDRVKISGFARFSTGSSAEASRGLGAARFLSPEQIRHHLADERSDLYAIGVMAFLALGGRPPFDGATEFDVMRAHLEDPVPDLGALRPAVPPELAYWVHQALAKAPEGRQATAMEMLEQLRQIAVLAGMSMMSGPAQQVRPGPLVPPMPPSLVMQQAALAPRSQPPKPVSLQAGAPAVPSLPAHASPGVSYPQSGVGASLVNGSSNASPSPVAAPASWPSQRESSGPATGLEKLYPGLSAPRPAPPPVAVVPARSSEQSHAFQAESSRAAVLAQPSAASAIQPNRARPAPPPAPFVPAAPPPTAAPPATVAQPKSLPPEASPAPAPPHAPASPSPKIGSPGAPQAAASAPAAPEGAGAMSGATPVRLSAPRQDPMRLTPAGGLQIQRGEEADFFGVAGESEDGPDDFSDLEESHPRHARRRRLIYLLVASLAGVAALSYFLVGILNPYGRGGDSTRATRPEGWIDQLTSAAYLSDPELVGEAADGGKGAASPPGRPGMSPEAMSPEAMSPEAMSPEAMSPEAMAPSQGASRPASGNQEASALGAEAQKLIGSNRGKAEELAERALKVDPNEPVAKKVLAGILEGKAKNHLYAGRNSDAVVAAQRATALDPGRPEPWFFLGVASHELRKPAEAKQALAQYLQLCPKCGYNSTFAQQILQSLR